MSSDEKQMQQIVSLIIGNTDYTLLHRPLYEHGQLEAHFQCVKPNGAVFCFDIMTPNGYDWGMSLHGTRPDFLNAPIVHNGEPGMLCLYEPVWLNAHNQGTPFSKTDIVHFLNVNEPKLYDDIVVKGLFVKPSVMPLENDDRTWVSVQFPQVNYRCFINSRTMYEKPLPTEPDNRVANIER
jgi:hypothetical protein